MTFQQISRNWLYSRVVCGLPKELGACANSTFPHLPYFCQPFCGSPLFCEVVRHAIKYSHSLCLDNNLSMLCELGGWGYPGMYCWQTVFTQKQKMPHQGIAVSLLEEDTHKTPVCVYLDCPSHTNKLAQNCSTFYGAMFFVKRCHYFGGFQYITNRSDIAQLYHWALCWHIPKLSCSTLVREADQRLELFLPVLLYCPVSESISGAGQSCVRGMPVSTIFCTVQVLQEPKKKKSVHFTE